MCSLYKNINQEAINIYKDIRSKKYVLANNSCCFNCLLPTVICSSLKVKEDNKYICLNKQFIFQVIALFFIKKEQLDIENRFQVESIKYLGSFIKLFLNKIFLKDLDTESIFGIKILREILLNKR